MKVGVPTEIKTDEYRVALTPAGRARARRRRPRGVRAERSRRGILDLRRGLRRPGRDDPARRRRGVRRGDPDRQGQGAPAGRGRAAAAAPHPVHLPAPRRRRDADPRPDGVRRDLHRLRDGRGHARAPAAAGADVRGRRQDRHPGWRVHAREAAGRPRHPARRRAGRRGGRRDGDRRRRGRHERRLHRARHGGDGVRVRPQHRPPARARHRLRRPRRHVLRHDAVDRGSTADGGSGDRGGARARRQSAARDHPPAARADEAPGGARRRLDRPGRLL